MIDQSYAASLHAFRKAVLAAIRNVELTCLKSGFSHEQVVPLATYAPWRDDPAFLTVYESVKEHTLVDIYRCYELWYLTKSLKSVTGDALEIGVWRGGTAALLGSAIAAVEDSCHLWLADTFNGVTKAGSEHDTRYYGGEHADTSEEIVGQLLRRHNLLNHTILKGVFPDQTGTAIERTTIKLCHIDVDAYRSAKDAFAFVWPRIAVGGVVVFDDYGFWGCEGVTKAVNELSAQGLMVIRNLNGHAVICKVASGAGA